jgi:hypothetical protein
MAAAMFIAIFQAFTGFSTVDILKDIFGNWIVRGRSRI